MNIRHFVMVNSNVYVSENAPNGGCKGCSFEAQNAHEEPCRSVECDGLIYKQAELREITMLLAGSKDENT